MPAMSSAGRPSMTGDRSKGQNCLAASSINGSNGGGAVWRRPIDSVVRVDQLFERGSKRELRQENAQRRCVHGVEPRVRPHELECPLVA